MVDIDTSDIVIEKSPLTSQGPSSYSATWAGDLKQDGKSGNSYDM